MFEKFFGQFNAYLSSHPTFLAKLKLLFWLKYWALTGLMAFFVFLIFRERRFSGRPRARNPARGKRRRYCFKA